MNRSELIQTIGEKKSFLCVGLDSDFEKLPTHLLKKKNPQFLFNKAIIDATREHCVAYKINTAFYESQGVIGWKAMAETIEYIGTSHFIIADAKRGDIGNTSKQYAKAFFETLNCDAITVAPYMGEDSIRPFLEYTDKFTIVLALTSNVGAADFEEPNDLYKRVMQKTMEWGSVDNLMFVVGATRAEKLQELRKFTPDHFFLVPGVGAQGGNLSDVIKYGSNADGGLLINSSREIIFADSSNNFAQAAGLKSENIKDQMQRAKCYKNEPTRIFS